VRSRVVDALDQRDTERRRLAAEVTALKRSTVGPNLQPADMRGRLKGFLDDWRDLLSENSAEARGVLDGVPADRIRFTPDSSHRRYELTIPIAFDRVLACVLPELRGLQETMASPTGDAATYFELPIVGDTRRAA